MSSVSEKLRFTFADPSDDGELRQLLRSTPMRGFVRVGFEHEPNYFHGTAIAGAQDRTLIARENGQIVATGRCTVQPRWLNGEIRRCAYLGELRLDAKLQGRWDILRGGYEFFATEYARDPADFCFTSIIADNQRARRFLERGLRAMPRYKALSSFTTLLLRARITTPAVPVGFQLVSGASVSAEQLVEFLNSWACRQNLAMHWSTERLALLARHGLDAKDFIVLLNDTLIVGCAAVWDQRKFRQIVIHGYSPWLAALRPFVNFAGALLRQPHLPAPGDTLAQAFLSPLAIAPESVAALPLVINAGLATAARRGLECLSVGFCDGDPFWKNVARLFAGRSYRSHLYAVSFPKMAAGISKLDARPCLPELALL